jgi:hypothetical protein
VIEPTITLSEVNRAKRKRPDSLDAYDRVMRAMPAIWSHDAGTIQEALRLTEEAIRLDETYALPRALQAWCYAQRIAYLHSSNPAEDRIAARNLARVQRLSRRKMGRFERRGRFTLRWPMSVGWRAEHTSTPQLLGCQAGILSCL